LGFEISDEGVYYVEALDGFRDDWIGHLLIFFDEDVDRIFGYLVLLLS